MSNDTSPCPSVGMVRSGRVDRLRGAPSMKRAAPKPTWRTATERARPPPSSSVVCDSETVRPSRCPPWTKWTSGFVFGPTSGLTPEYHRVENHGEGSRPSRQPTVR